MPAKIKDTSNIRAAQERHRSGGGGLASFSQSHKPEGSGLTTFSQSHKPITPKVELIQLVVFRLEDESFGTDINQVREIVRVGAVTPIPDSPNFIKGVTNIRGEIIIVIGLKERFFLPVKKPIESKHIVITGQEGNLYGVLVDEVTEVLRIPRTEIKTTPHLITKIDRTYIDGVLILENRLIMLLDLKKVLSEEDLSKLARLTLSHRPEGGGLASDKPEGDGAASDSRSHSQSHKEAWPEEPESFEAQDFSAQAPEEPVSRRKTDARLPAGGQASKAQKAAKAKRSRK